VGVCGEIPTRAKGEPRLVFFSYSYHSVLSPLLAPSSHPFTMSRGGGTILLRDPMRGRASPVGIRAAGPRWSPWGQAYARAPWGPPGTTLPTMGLQKSSLGPQAFPQHDFSGGCSTSIRPSFLVVVPGGGPGTLDYVSPRAGGNGGASPAQLGNFLGGPPRPRSPKTCGLPAPPVGDVTPVPPASAPFV